MRAARLKRAKTPLVIEQIEEPHLHPGGVIIRVVAAPVISYTKEVFAREGTHNSPPVPYTPGPSGIGVIEQIADDVSGLQIGDMVFCDPRLHTHGNGSVPEGIFIGWFGLTPHAEKLLVLWKNGAFAEKAACPAECLTSLGEVPKLVEPARLTSLHNLTIAYGALLRGDFQVGQTLVVSGATGNLGAAAVLLALAMGAEKVVAVGRNAATLETLRQLDVKRVVPVHLQGDHVIDTRQMQERAGMADLVIDFLGTSATSPDTTLACISVLRPQGIAVFAGGVPADIPLRYMNVVRQELTIRGSFMYPRFVPARLLKMIASGMLDLTSITVTTFPFEQINEAVQHASTLSGLNYCGIVFPGNMKEILI